MFRIAAALLLVSAMGVHAGTADDAKSLLQSWNPKEVSFEDGELTVILPQGRITEDIYLAALRFGLCLGPFSGLPLTEVVEIKVLNEFGVQGYVYEDGLADCTAFNQRPAGDKRTVIAIMGKTHIY